MSKQRYRLAVGLSAMRDTDDQDKQFFAIDNIEDALFSHPEPSPTRKPAITVARPRKDVRGGNQWRGECPLCAPGG